MNFMILKGMWKRKGECSGTQGMCSEGLLLATN